MEREMDRWLQSICCLLLCSCGIVANAADDALLEEEAFRKLHRLIGDQAPEVSGTDVQVGSTRGYLSLPKTRQKTRSAVILFHEYWGLNPNIKHWADRLAREGHAALAIDLYGGKIAKNSKEAMTLMRGVQHNIAAKTIADALRFVHRDERVDAERVGSIGWSFGGTWALDAAMHHPGIDACVVYYGKTTSDLEKLSGVGGAVLGIFGKNDPSIPQQQVDSFRSALEMAKIRHQIHTFEAGHAFANPSGSRYVAEASMKSWVLVREFFARELQPKKPAEKSPDKQKKVESR
ncbi:MAG TPA: dienelactone hydrolase family protein [Planctomycetes bacterium]|nr:dienelactone hydrolase family protein [Planctomycetota bacterium]HIK81541.1 dienelactone hydrolase family protein [Planctomycetota bacterium]